MTYLLICHNEYYPAGGIFDVKAIGHNIESVSLYEFRDHAGRLVQTSSYDVAYIAYVGGGHCEVVQYFDVATGWSEILKDAFDTP